MAHIITIDEKLDGMTLKAFFHAYYPHLPHHLIQRWLRTGEIKINSQKTELKATLYQGHQLRLPPPHFMAGGEEASVGQGKLSPDMADEKLRSITMATTDDYIVINKPAGLAVQGGNNVKESLDDWLFAINQRTQLKNHYRLVHRLDRDTSGVMVIACHLTSAQFLTRAFAERAIEKTYIAMVTTPDKKLPAVFSASIKKWGSQDMEKMTIADDADPNAQSATTHIKYLAHKNNRSLLALQPITGRKHQLRVHLSHLSSPIVGDKKYGGEKNRHLLLHAWRLTLPDKNTYQAPPPDYFYIHGFSDRDLPT